MPLKNKSIRSTRPKSLLRPKLKPRRKLLQNLNTPTSKRLLLRRRLPMSSSKFKNFNNNWLSSRNRITREVKRLRRSSRSSKRKKQRLLKRPRRPRLRLLRATKQARRSKRLMLNN